MNTLTLALEDSDLIRVILFGGGIVIALTVIAFNGVKSLTKTKEAEQTKREIAAYVAEGSMTPEDAEVILSGKRRKCSSGSCACGRKSASAAKPA